MREICKAAFYFLLCQEFIIHFLPKQWHIMHILPLATAELYRNCREYQQFWLCDHSAEHSAYQYFMTRFHSKKTMIKTIGDIPKRECMRTANHNDMFSLVWNVISPSNQTITVPLLLYRLVGCYSTGNMLGNYLEAAAFAIKNNIALGRINGNCDSLHFHQTVLKRIPLLIIPKLLKQQPMQLTKEQCKQIPSLHAWTDAKSLLWQYPGLITYLIDSTIRAYHIEHLLPSRHGHGHSSSNHGQQLQTAVGEIAETEALAIHYRCRDNVNEIIYGVFPFSTYVQLLTKILDSHHLSSGSSSSSGNGGSQQYIANFSKVIIYSDAKLSAEYGTVCWQLLGLLRDKITTLPGYDHLAVEIVYASPSDTFALMHSSKVLICSVSTFCFFAGHGARQVYSHSPDQVVQPPASFWKQQIQLTHTTTTANNAPSSGQVASSAASSSSLLPTTLQQLWSAGTGTASSKQQQQQQLHGSVSSSNGNDSSDSSIPWSLNFYGFSSPTLYKEKKVSWSEFSNLVSKS